MTFINKNEPENKSSLRDSRPYHFTSSFNAKYARKNAVLSHKRSSCIPTYSPSPPHLTSSSCIVCFFNTPFSYHLMFCNKSFRPGFCLLMEYVTGDGHSVVVALLSANMACTQVNIVLMTGKEMKNEISVLQKTCRHCTVMTLLSFHFKPEVCIIKLILKQNVITYKIQNKK